MSHPIESAKSVWELFERAFIAFSERPCFGTRSSSSEEFVWQSYKQVRSVLCHNVTF